MGTTSAGASGSGSGLRAAGGAGWSSGSGFFESDGSRMMTAQPGKAEIEDEVRTIAVALFSRAEAYVRESFCNAYIKALYKELFKLCEFIQGKGNVEQVMRAYSLDMNESGFIFSLLDKLGNMFSKDGIDPRCTETARSALENLLFKALGDRQDLAATGDGKSVIKAMTINTEFCRRLSYHFLAVFGETLFLKEMERKVPRAIFSIRRTLERRTDAVISEFESRPKAEETDNSSLLEYICENWEWFKREMTK
jgi:hypothetical protein